MGKTNVYGTTPNGMYNIGPLKTPTGRYWPRPLDLLPDSPSRSGTNLDLEPSYVALYIVETVDTPSNCSLPPLGTLRLADMADTSVY